VHRYTAGQQGAILVVAGPDAREGPQRTTVASKHLKEIVAPH
jgi:hypothetical protein